MSDSTWSGREACEVEAMVQLMFIVARADGDFSPTERRRFLDTVQSLSAGKLQSTDLLSLIEQTERTIEEVGLDQHLKSLAGQFSDELARRLAYGLCAQVALSDGTYQDAERQVLDQIASILSLSPEDDEEIVQSVRLSQRPPAE
jgi:tellurite resistance protein